MKFATGVHEAASSFCMCVCVYLREYSYCICCMLLATSPPPELLLLLLFLLQFLFFVAFHATFTSIFPYSNNPRHITLPPPAIRWRTHTYVDTYSTPHS